jgi:hypothetical protein
MDAVASGWLRPFPNRDASDGHRPIRGIRLGRWGAEKLSFDLTASE